MRRYAFAPLLEALGCDETSVKARLGLDHRQVARYVSQGLREERADRLAVRAGLHPAAVWHDFGMRPCIECGELFAPFRVTHLSCSWNCSARRRRRERYATDPAYREDRKARAKAHKATNPRAEAVASAAYRAANRAERARRERERYHAAKKAS